MMPGYLFGASSVKITSDAPNGKVEVGETFHITIEAINCAGKIDLTSMPPGVKKVYHTSQSRSSHSVVNGRTESMNATSLILTCKGETPGTYKFGPVSVDGTRSNVLSYQVIPATGKKSNNSGSNTSNTNGSQGLPAGFDPNSGPMFVGKGNEEMFLKANVNKTTAYEQEAIEYTVKLYTTYGDIKFLGAAAAPKFDGFVVEESDDVSTSFRFEDLNGKTYKTAIIARYIIFPQKSGSLKVLGNTYTVSTDARQYYHDPYFQTMTVKYPVQLNVTPNEVTINVKGLPTPVPDNFIGGVGKFEIHSSMPSTNLTSNTAASLIYTISGTGNVKYVKMPELANLFPPSLEVYSPENTVDIKVGSSNVTGSSKFDYSIMPRETGDITIPSLTLTYFDPEDGQYKTLRTESYNITVAQGQASSKSQQAVRFNPNLLPEGKLSKKIGNLYIESFLYWLWFIIPMIIFALSLVLYRKYLRDHADLTQLRSKKANQMALKRLAKAYQCYKSNKEEQFYDEMLAALWGYIGDKLKMPTSELNRSNVGDEFKKHGVKEETFMPIINLIDECEYAKYTPVSRKANMSQLYTDAVNSLGKVESEYEEETHTKADDNDIDSDIPSKENGSGGGSAIYVNSSMNDASGETTRLNTESETNENIPE